MKMEQHLITGRSESMDEIAELAPLAEESGFTHIGFPDQPALNRDPFLMMAVAAQATRHIRVGTGIVTPFTYHPIVIANASATVDELSNGRAFLGLGVGGAAVMSMGLKPRPVAELRETAQFVKKFMAGEEAEYKGGHMYSDWIRNSVPLYVAVDGPKGHQVAGEFADGVYVQSVHPVVTKWRMELIEKAALKVGRDPSKIVIVPSTIIYPEESKGAAWREVAGQVASKLRRSGGIWSSNTPEMVDLRQRLERADPGLVDEIIRVRDQVNEVFEEHKHEHVDPPHAAPVTQRLIDFFLLVGNSEDICERVDQLQDMGVNGMCNLWVSIIDKKGLMREIGNQVLPYVGN